MFVPSDHMKEESRWWGRLRNAGFVGMLIVAVAGYLYIAALEGQALDLALQIGMK
jgi:hypothetical protein